MPDPIVNTGRGPVRGVHRSSLDVFRGIPYAAPPTGLLRWQPPEPADMWIEPLDASEFGPAAPQTPDERELALDAPQGEDCLTLNIWTPNVDDKRRPVMVWVHGGAFSWGSARNDLYDGSRFAARGDIVVVTIQYRLGALGWLDLQPLGHAASPNNGLLDQVAALQWVSDNIGAFGGDQDNVTLAGESAGGISIGALMANPRAEGLFHRAILQSGSPGLIASKPWAKGVLDEFTKHANVNSVEDLRNLTTDQVLDAQARLFKSKFADTAFHPVVDGDIVPAAPIQQLRERSEPTVPTLIGTTLDEARYWILEDNNLDQLPLSFFMPWLGAITHGHAGGVVEAYRQQHPDYTDAQIGLAISGDTAFRLPGIATAEALDRSATPVWMYLFTLKSTCLDGRLGSPHAMELPFTFNNIHADGASDFIDPAAADYQPLADVIQDAWISFVRHGTPQTPALGDWPAYDDTERSTMVLNLEPRLEDAPFDGTRSIWGSVPFDGVTPGIADVNPLTHEGTRFVAPAAYMYATRGINAASRIGRRFAGRVRSR